MDDDRLDSWKEIAAYLGRGVTTVQRWEQAENLPVHRLPHTKRSSVFAFKQDLDAWQMKRAQGNIAAVAGSPPWRTRRFNIAAAVATIALIAFAIPAALYWPRPDRDRSIFVSAPTISKPLVNDSSSETGPSLSPDGDRVVYRWERPNAAGLYIKPIAGGPPYRLRIEDAGAFVAVSRPKWSPQGDLIAFLATENHNREAPRGLYVVSSSGGSPRRLTSIAGVGLCWSPDGRLLAFADRNSSGEPYSIFSISLDTGHRQRLTTPPLGTFGDTYCAISPDGRRLAVSRYFSRYQSDLVVVPVPANGPESAERLTSDFQGIEGVEWTPDGDEIVFGSHSGLWRIRSSTKVRQAPMLLTGSASTDTSPSFSRPKGGGAARLAYEHNIRDVNIWRWRAGAEGGSSTRLPGSTQWEDFPAFSPDGHRIAFASNRTGRNEIWIANADGSDPRRVTFHDGPVVISPQWSPDGQRLVFSSQVGGNRDIYVIRADGSDSQRLTWEPSQDENPSWARDGRWVYFRSDRSGVAQIWKVPADGGSAVRVTNGEASLGFESPDGKLLYFVRGMGIPGVWATSVTGGDETFVLADVNEGFWGVADSGIAFLLTAQKGVRETPEIRFFDFWSKRISTLATLPGTNTVLTGFAVSRDARSVLWTRLDSYQSDLMLVDEWKPGASQQAVDQEGTAEQSVPRS